MNKESSMLTYAGKEILKDAQAAAGVFDAFAGRIWRNTEQTRALVREVVFSRVRKTLYGRNKMRYAAPVLR